MLVEIIKVNKTQKKHSNWSLRDYISFIVKLITLDKIVILLLTWMKINYISIFISCYEANNETGSHIQSKTVLKSRKEKTLTRDLHLRD